MPRVSSKDGVAGPGVRGASGVPTRREFRERGVRYEDNQGRIYVLAKQDDPAFIHRVRLGAVDEETYERKLRRGLEFNPQEEIKELTSRVMMYVQLPPPVGKAATSVERQRIQMPIPTASAPSRREGVLVLREIATNRYYEAHVEEIQAKRRAKRGTIVLSNVTRLHQ